MSFIKTLMNSGLLSLTRQLRSAIKQVDLARKSATWFADRLTNLTNTFLSLKSDSKFLHFLTSLPKYDNRFPELFMACTTTRLSVFTITSLYCCSLIQLRASRTLIASAFSGATFPKLHFVLPLLVPLHDFLQ